jgi:hypothetical protein
MGKVNTHLGSAVGGGIGLLLSVVLGQDYLGQHQLGWVTPWLVLVSGLVVVLGLGGLVWDGWRWFSCFRAAHATPVGRFRLQLERVTQQLRVRVTNDGPAAEFEIQVLDIQQADVTVHPPWSLPWDDGKSRAQLLSGQTRYVTLVEFDRAAAQSMWNRHAVEGPFVFLDGSGPQHLAYCGSLMADNAAEMGLVRVCVRIAVFSVDPPDRIERVIRFGFFGDDAITDGACEPAGHDAIHESRTQRDQRIGDIKRAIRTELVAPRFGRLVLRPGEERQLVEFLFDVGVGLVTPDTQLSLGRVQLDDGSAEDRLRPQNMFGAATQEVSLDLAADGEGTLRLIQNTLQQDLMPAVRSLEWQQRLTAALRQ